MQYQSRSHPETDFHSDFSGAFIRENATVIRAGLREIMRGIDVPRYYDAFTRLTPEKNTRENHVTEDL